MTAHPGSPVKKHIDTSFKKKKKLFNCFAMLVGPCTMSCIVIADYKKTLRKVWSISLNSSIEVPRVGLSNKVISCRRTESGAPSLLTGSSMPHLITTGLSFHSPLYTCEDRNPQNSKRIHFYVCKSVVGEVGVILTSV